MKFAEALEKAKELSGKTDDEWKECMFRGEHVGYQLCSSCKGRVRLKMFNCSFFNKEVSIRDCKQCLEVKKKEETKAECATASIIISRNEGAELLETVRCLYDENGVSEIIIVDDKSDDGSLDPFIDKKGESKIPTTTGLPNITVVRPEQHVGCSYGRDIGVDHCDLTKTKVALFLDAHMRVSGQQIAKLGQYALDNNVIVQAASRGLPLKDVFWAFGCEWKYTPNEEAPFKLKWWQGDKPDKELMRVHGLMGGCYAFPIDTYEKLGGAYTGSLYGWTEELLSYKAACMDIPIYVTRDISARHWYQKPRGFPCPTSEHMKGMFGYFKIVLEGKTFANIFPKLRSKYWNREIEDMLEHDEKLHKSHTFFQENRVHDDKWFFATYVPELIGLRS